MKPSSRTRRTMSCVYWEPKSMTAVILDMGAELSRSAARFQTAKRAGTPQPQAACRRMGLFLFRISCGSVAQADGRQRESALSEGTLLEKRIPTAPRKFRERKFLPRMSADAFAGTLPRETTSRRGRRRGRASARRRRRDRSALKSECGTAENQSLRIKASQFFLGFRKSRNISETAYAARAPKRRFVQ